MLISLHYAVRVLRKDPGFTAVAICSLALGIGATSAMFTFADAVLLRPLPYANPGQLVWLTLTIPLFHADMATTIDY